MENCSKKERQSLYVLIVIFIIFSAGIIATGHFYYRSYKKNYRTEVERQLSAIAELKAGELVQWRKERLGDADILYKNAVFFALVQHCFEKPEDTEAQGQLRMWMDKILSSAQCDRVYLLDVQGIERASVPGTEPIASIIARNASKVLQLKQMVFTDFYRNEHNQKIYLNILVPILDEANDNRGVGVLVLRIDPERYLYPLISRWPTPSRTAETLLVRREGDDVRFLNELRFMKNTALTLWSFLKNEKMLAVKASLGQEGIAEGIDYRGVPVIACVRSVPNSPWFIVARMDTSEVYAPIQERLWTIIIFVGISLLGAGTGVGIIWRYQKAEFYEEKYKAAAAMRDSEAIYKTLYESSRDAIMLLAPPSWKFFAANTATIALFGAKDEAEFYSFPPWTLSPEYQPDGQPSSEKAKSMIEKAMKEGSNFFEWQHKRVDGKEFTATVLLNSLVLKGNKLLQATVKDISEQKHASQQLKENESRLAVLFEANPTGLVLIKRESRKIAQVNSAAAKMVGLPSERIVGQVCHGFMCPAERDRCPICDLGQRVDRSERILLTANGSKLPILKTVEGITLGGKKYLLESFIDITERKQAEKLLRESEETYRKQFEGAMDAIFVADAQTGILLDCNEAALKLVGRERSEVIGKSHAILHPPEEIEGELSRSFKRHLLDKEGQVLETRVVTKTGEIKDVAIKASLIEIKGKKVLQGIFRDVTEQKKTEQALENLNEDLKATIEKLTAANREIQEFAHITTHDLKAPLRGIGVLAEWLATDYADKFDDEGRKSIHLLMSRVNRLYGQIDNILRYSEIGQATVKKSEVDLNTLIEEIKNSIAVPENVKVAIDGNLPKIICEKIHIAQLFQNLISNAVRFMDKPSGLITINCADEGDCWKFSVTDNGPGIKKQYFERIFRIFQTLTTNDADNGTGMGLAIVKKIVELYGGRVWVESEVGQGSTFLFTLPKQKQEAVVNG